MSATSTSTTIDFRRLYLDEKQKKRTTRKTKATTTSTIIQNENDATTTTILQKTSTNSNNQHNNIDSNISISFSSIKILDKYKLSFIHPTIYYVPNFLSSDINDTTDNNQNLLSWLHSLPEYHTTTTTTTKKKTNNNYMDNIGIWNKLHHAKRKVILFDSSSSPNSSLPNPLQEISNKLVSLNIFPQSKKPNHVLINEYQSGQGILPHTDGPSYYPQTATISIGGNNVIVKFTPRLGTKEIGNSSGNMNSTEVLLHGNGSLLLFSEKMYSDYCHSIDEVDVEETSDLCCNASKCVLVKRGYRVSLTFRYKE